MYRKQFDSYDWIQYYMCSYGFLYNYSSMYDCHHLSILDLSKDFNIVDKLL